MHRHLGQVYGHLLDQIVFRPGLLVQIVVVLLQFVEPVTLYMLAFVRLARLLLSRLNELECPLLLAAGLGAVLDLYAQHLVEEMLKEVQDGRGVHLILYYLEDVQLLSFDGLDRDLLLGDLLVHCLHTQWVDVLELGGNEH